MNLPTDDIYIFYNPEAKQLTLKNPLKSTTDPKDATALENFTSELNKLYREKKSCFGKSKPEKISQSEIERIQKKYSAELDRNFTVVNESTRGARIEFAGVKFKIVGKGGPKYVSGIFSPNDLNRVRKPN